MTQPLGPKTGSFEPPTDLDTPVRRAVTELRGEETALQKGLNLHRRLETACLALAALTSEERVALMAAYCPGCGVPVPPTCHCQNED